MEVLLGKTTSEVLTHIARNDNGIIRSFYLTGYILPGDYTNPIFSGPLELPAEEVRKTNWFKTRKSEIFKALSGSRLSGDYPATLYERVKPQYVSVASKVMRRNGSIYSEELHLPMLDYDTYVYSEQAMAEAVENFKRILEELKFPEGVILNSGGGFHYLGLRLTLRDSYAEALEMARRFDFTVPPYHGLDKRWMTIFRDHGVSTLRLNTNVVKTEIPTVVSLFQSKS